MPRTRNFEQTRGRLLDAASRLFASRGYDQTAVEAIIAQAGVSKGAFYHHFSSKEEILEAMARQMAADSVKAVTDALAAGPVDALVRLNLFLAGFRSWRVANLGLLREVYAVAGRDENAIMRRKMEVHGIALAQPVLAGILRQGIADGVFDLPDAEETSRLVLLLSHSVGVLQMRTLAEWDGSAAGLARLERRADIFTTLLERMLALGQGSLARPDIGEVMKSMGKEETK
jgi:AcrR family transcriptional regulator